MFFYFVKSGDSISKIAKLYNISKDQIINDNSIINPDNLVVNQCLLIRPLNKEYIVKPGDSLYKIAKDNNLSLDKIKKYNPELNDILYPNQKIDLIYNNNDKDKIITNGYCYDTSNINAVKNALNYLTFLSIFSYRINDDGTLSNIDDEKLVSLANESGTKPILVITNTKQRGGFSPDLARNIISNNNIINELFNNILKILIEKNYYGINIDFEYVYPEDKNKYISFLKKASKYFKEKGYYFSVALAPKYNKEQKGLLYEAHDYQEIGLLADNVVIMTYEWGYTYGPSMPVAPYQEVKKVLTYAVSEIDSKKILMGIPNYGYDFIIPYKEKQKADSISNNEAIPIAFKNNASITHSSLSKTPSFKYKKDNIMHEVHFDDPCSIEQKLTLIDDFNLGGLSIWTISKCCNFYYLLIDNYFEIVKK